MHLEALGKMARAKDLGAVGAERRGRRGVNRLENDAIVAEFILSHHAESITYNRRCKECWMESATNPTF
jgi:hypothetical protein